jgi:hypothetical protein
METKAQLLFLIESEIRATQLIGWFPEYDIEFFDVYLADYSTFIFELLGIDTVHCTEELYTKYFSLVRAGKHIDLKNDKVALAEHALQIYNYLTEYKNACFTLPNGRAI